MNPQHNRKAFLDMTAFSEGTCQEKHPLTRLDGYDVIVTGVNGPEIFTDFSEHPFAHRSAKKINTKGLFSTASGRYQHMKKDWIHYRDLLKLPDFGPDSQDKWALQLVKERGAIILIDAGNIREAVKRCNNLWASFPGAGYGQFEHAMEPLIDAYVRAGGEMK
jgi:muramidase (phage lysozyme)